MNAPAKRLLAEVRHRWLDRSPGDARRLFHGRGQCHEGLGFINVDWFAPVVLITCYHDEVDRWLEELLSGLRELLGAALSCVVVQRRQRRGSPSEVVLGTLPADPRAHEAALRYRLSLGRSQNVGFFLDMQPGRALVRTLAPGRRTLNLFAYTCAFSVVALAAGARHVVNLDMNRRALAIGRDNHRDNALDLRRVTMLGHDLFKSFGKLRRLGPYELIVVDPPTDQGRSFEALRDWPRLVRRLPDMLAPGGDVVACLNSPRLDAAFLVDLFAEHLPGVELRGRCPPHPDFPDRDAEGGLKVLHFGSRS